MRNVELEYRPIERELIDPLGATTVAYGMRGLNWKGRAKYRFLTWKFARELRSIYRAAIRTKVLYYGPFKGEFGHFLLHNLPFLVHLHQQGVALHYCGMELHKPFLVDEAGNSIIARWYPLRDFFNEVRPNANETLLPPDVEREVDQFKRLAQRSGFPFLDISKNDRYWFVFRNWQLNGRQNIYNLQPIYSQGKRSQCVIFPRKKGAPSTTNNGEPWDYNAMANAVAPYFDEVLLVGHPSMSAEVQASESFRVCTSADNIDTLKHCASAQLIITQHSGAVHLGAYVDTPVLVVFKGEKPVKGLVDTLRFRKNLTSRPLHYALSELEVIDYVKRLNS